MPLSQAINFSGFILLNLNCFMLETTANEESWPNSKVKWQKTGLFRTVAEWGRIHNERYVGIKVISSAIEIPCKDSREEMKKSCVFCFRLQCKILTIAWRKNKASLLKQAALHKRESLIQKKIFILCSFSSDNKVGNLLYSKSHFKSVKPLHSWNCLQMVPFNNITVIYFSVFH